MNLPPALAVTEARQRRATLRNPVGRARSLGGFVTRLTSPGPIPPVLVAYDRPFRTAWMVVGPPLVDADRLNEVVPTMAAVVIGLPQLGAITCGVDVDAGEAAALAVLDVAPAQAPMIHVVRYETEDGTSAGGEATWLRTVDGEPELVDLGASGLGPIVAALAVALNLPRRPDEAEAIAAWQRRAGIQTTRVVL